jgi:hypothetical protein
MSRYSTEQLDKLEVVFSSFHSLSLNTDLLLLMGRLKEVFEMFGT